MNRTPELYPNLSQPRLTPMMEQYRSIKKTLPPQTILFFRLGDFYEMFFEDAVTASEILDITLTGREGGEAGRVPMCGIPYHAYQGYIRTLLDRNYKVAICEQIGTPQAGKGLVERKVTRIISPATYLDDESRTTTFEYLTALACRGKQWALAFLELSTGEFYVREIPEDRLYGELMLLVPREVVLSKTQETSEALMDFVKNTLKAVVTVYEDWVFDSKESMRLLQERFHLASAQSVSFYERDLAVSACGALLYYLRDHLHGALDHLRVPGLLEAQDFMVLDRQTQRSLELVAPLHSEAPGPTLLSTMDRTLTSMGARTLYQWMTHPLLSIPEIMIRQEAVGEMVRPTRLLQGICGLFKGVRDMERTLSRLNYGVAHARDLINLKVFLARVPEMKKLLSCAQSCFFKTAEEEMHPFPELSELIERAILEEPSLSVRDGGMIRDGYAQDLDELRDISRNGKNWILEFQKREMERTGIKSLRVKYSHVFGYALEVSQASLHLVPADYIRRQTLANAERFVVPELKLWDETITGAEDKIKALEYEIFNQVRIQVLTQLEGLQKMARAVGRLDALASFALVGLERRWVPPVLVSGGELLIQSGRHPVVEGMLPAGQFVENDLCLDTSENQLCVLTGPNMAGKSTYIRQTALLVLLAQTGSYVPAKSARIGLVDRIFTRIGASDNLSRGESTFMVEMVETAHILQKATSKSLLILDEVGRGTSTFDGVSIAWAICEYLAGGSVRPRTMFATHYHELTQLEAHWPGIKNYNITVRETKDGIIFLRKVVRGGSDRSYGIHVAKLAGIPKTVTERAQKILEILENENTEASLIIEGKGLNEKTIASSDRSFLETAPRNHPLLETIEKMALDVLTPLEALNKIAEWKEQLSTGFYG